MGWNTSVNPDGKFCFQSTQMKLEEEMAWFKGFHQIHWQCQPGAPWLETGYAWTAYTTGTAKRVRILTAICGVFFPKQNYFLKIRIYNALLFQVNDFKTMQQSKPLALPERNPCDLALVIPGLRSQVDCNPGLLTQQDCLTSSIY